MTLSDDQLQIIVIATQTGAALSIVGIVFIFISYALVAELRKFFSLRLVVILSFADLLYSMSFTLGLFIDMSTERADDPTSFCKFQGTLMHHAGLSAAAWTTVLALNLFLVVCQDDRRSHRYEPYFHLFAWGIASAMTIIAYPKIAISTNWCWIPPGPYRWTEDGPLTAFIIFIVWVYIRGKLTLRQRRSLELGDDEADTREAAHSGRIFRVLGVFMFCYGPTVLVRIMEVVTPNQVAFELYLIQAITAPLQGLLNALVWGVNRHVRKAIMRWYRPQFDDRVALLPHNKESTGG